MNRNTIFKIILISLVVVIVFGVIRLILVEKYKPFCEYDGIEAACNQLVISLPVSYSVDENDTIVGFDEVEKIINENGGRIIQKMDSLGVVVIEVKPTEKLLLLKDVLSESEYVLSVNFNMVVTFDV